MKYLLPMVARDNSTRTTAGRPRLGVLQNGFAATSMIDVAEVTGVQRGSLYNAYGDKERLFLLAYERYSSQFLDSVRLALSEPDPVVALTTCSRALSST